jgi:uncharacterized protein YggE
VSRFLIVASVFLVAAPAFGQLESHTLTIAATRQINLQPDQVVFGVAVSSSVGTNLSQIVAALAGLAITSANFTGVNNDLAPELQWTFTLAVPLSNLTGTIGALTKLEQTIAQNNSGLALTFSVNGTQVSPQLQQSQSCSTSDLIADATAQAQKLAAAAGLTIGPILGLTNVSSTPTSGAAGYSILNVGVAAAVFYPSAPPVACSLTVEFQLQP